MQIAQLRQATEADHAAVEGSLAFMEPDLTVGKYTVALERMYGFVSAWEMLAETTASAKLQPYVRTRARRTLLAADIRSLNGHLSTEPSATLSAFDTQSEFLGALYVMEGSRLGGQFIARHVETSLGLGEGCGTTYFRGFGDTTGSNWKELLGLLASEIPDNESEQTIAAAKKMFRAFHSWMIHAVPVPSLQTTPSASAGDSQHG